MTLGALAVIAVFIIALALAANPMSRLPVTPPMLAVLVGLGMFGLGNEHISITLGSEEVLLLAEVTLIVLLFSDASRISPDSLRDTRSLPFRLLLVGLPLTAFAGTASIAWILTDLSWTQAGLVAAMLTPTDAALGQAVVSSPVVPARVRHALEVESGLNDGLIVPVVGVFIALVEGAELESNGAIALEAFGEVTIGLVVGAVGGFGFGKLATVALDRSMTSLPRMRLAALAALGATVGLAISGGGNGFIAAFVAGMALRLAAGERTEGWLSLPDNLGQLGAIVAFVVFGATMVGSSLGSLNWAVVLCALAMLTVVRMGPVAIALFGSGLQRPTIAFIGWFGPRGLASILFALTLSTEAMVDEREQLVSIVTITVLGSIFLHGVTAVPLSNRYGTWLRAHPAGDVLDEHREVPVQRTRPNLMTDT